MTVVLVLRVGTLAASVLVAACHEEGWLQYSWNDRRILCSHSIDDLSQDPEWDLAFDQLAIARDNDSVALLHAHYPARTITILGLQHFFQRVVDDGLAFVTYPELVASGERRAGVALAFDDHWIPAWHGLRNIFDYYGARLTFFVSRYPTRSDEELAMLADLAADGHAIAAHGIEHLNAERVIPEIGLQTYLDTEAVPSITLLRDAGYSVTAFAYPFGRNTEASDEVLLEHVDKIRISPGPCPY